MRGASADSLATLVDDLGAAVRGGGDGLVVGRDLFAVARLLQGEAGLRRILTDLAKGSAAKADLARGILDGKVSAAALDLVAKAASLRWAGTRDLADALEHLGVIAVVKGAEGAGEADRLEAELFGFVRLLAENHDLRDVLADPGRSDDDKRALLHGLLESKVGAGTLALVDQALVSSHRSIEVAVDQYQRLAAEQRDRLVAEVRVASPLTDAETVRLAEALSGQYDRPVHVNQIVDPEVIGGIRVEIGDDVIDGTVASRLDDARRRLAG